MTTAKKSRSALAAAAAAFLVAVPAHGQLPDASTSSLALAGNNTALARGFGAIGVNPAGLGMPGSGFSLAVAPVQVRVGLSPVTWGELVDYDGRLVPNPVKLDWLTRVEAAGGQTGRIGADATAFALTLGNFGFQLSSTASADVTLPPGVAEAALFGNAGRTGSPADLALAGADVESFAMTTAAMSFALPVSPSLVLGLTGKYSYGHGVAVGTSLSGRVESDPIRAEMDFPMVSTCLDEVGCTQDLVRGGSGFGFDVGAMLDLGNLTLGASLQNVLTNFAWDESRLAFRPGTVLFEDNEFTTEYDELPFAQAPASLQERVRDFKPRPAARLGAAFDVSSSLTLTGDVHGRLKDEGIALEPDYATGVGAELRLGVLHLRGGVTKITDAMQYGGGASLGLGPVSLSAAAGLIKGDMREVAMAHFGLSFGSR